MPGKGGDGIPRLQNIGGSSHANSMRIGEGRRNFDSELKISEEDMLLFRKEEPLIDLIRKGKISLSDKKIEFDKTDMSVIYRLYQYILSLSFVPYRTEMYQHKVYQKTF